LSFGRKVLLAGAGIAALAGPIAIGLVNAPQTRAQSPAAASAPPPAFEVVSIKPDHGDPRRIMIGMQPGGRFSAMNITVKFLLQEAYGMKDSQISGLPGWAETEHYDIEAKPEDSFVEQNRKLNRDEDQARVRLMLQGMLADRFQLKVHRESQETPVYALLVARNGPKMKESNQQEDVPLPSDAFAHRAQGPPNLSPEGFPAHPNVPATGAGIFTTIGTKGIRLTARQRTMHDLANALTAGASRPVVDETGLTAKYDFVLTFFRPGATTPDGEALPEIFSAIQSQLGLRLESQKRAVETLVIDHVERTPTAN